MKKTDQKILEGIIRVDHAGERGAIKIYEGQLLALNTIKQDESLKAIIEERSAGSVIVIDESTEHPFASVTVQVYVPAHKFVILEVVCPFDQE